jgi:hypothetical protein
MIYETVFYKYTKQSNELTSTLSEVKSNEMEARKIWSRLSYFDKDTNLFVHNLAYFKFIGFSMQQESSRLYSRYRITTMTCIGALLFFISWDIWNNLKSVQQLSEKIITSTVLLLGTIRMGLIVSSKISMRY